ncbi:MAG: YbjN domain-containing protein [Alphaproteobacteria bacterium]|nr:YbjN domain-containing protein [Alphaproteobacteria bacterium]MCC7046100.1 YbjN domain-containing protein [Alphaproteobacteria bacterium]
MTLSLAERSPSQSNPLDLVEEIVSAHDWPFERAGEEELLAQIAGRWGDYRLFFAWHPDLCALQFSCSLDVKVPDARKRPVVDLLALINESLWAGHFELCLDDATPTFRHSLLLRGAGGAAVEQLEDLVDIALSESDRFYPAFQFVIWGGKNPSDAMVSAMVDTIGEA